MTAAATPQIDAYREHITRLVDTAPPLTESQADVVRSILGGVTVTRVTHR
ncbi:hypothetical protein KUG88_18180 [Rhodococcus rhodochrous]|nr:hypothetical protein [Rhodococcus rhodochrous]MCB8912059.1 hypothetical protein [Rhodococcus rhodochrous]